MPANGEMLRLARQRKGFQQTEAANRLGIEQPLLSRVENGLSEPREEILLRAEQVYEVPRSFFDQTEPIYGAPVSVHPMWRKKADVTGREVDLVVAELNVRSFHLRRLLEAAEVANSLNLPRLDIEDYGDPSEIASVLRAHWKVPRGPVKDLTLLAERAGIIVVHSKMGGATISGVTFSVPGLPPVVMLNREQPADRMRYTLAHELGHLVMHRFPSPDMEKEANEFAGALLMPAEDIRSHFASQRIDLARLGALKLEWKVAMQALLLRARHLGFLSRNQEQYLWKQISARRMRIREPAQFDFKAETPTVLADLVRLHMESLGYSQSDLAALMNVHDWDLAELYALKSQEKTASKVTLLK